MRSYQLAIAPDGSRVLVAVTPSQNENEKGKFATDLDFYEVDTGRQHSTRAELSADPWFQAVYSPDGATIVIVQRAVASSDGRLTWLDARTGAEVATLKLATQAIAHAAYTSDGRRIAVIEEVGEKVTLRAWDIKPLLSGETPAPALTLTLAGLAGRFREFEISPDGRRLLTSGAGAVKLWDVDTGREVLTLKAPGVGTEAASFSPDGRKIWGGLDEDGRTWAWDATPIQKATSP